MTAHAALATFVAVLCLSGTIGVAWMLQTWQSSTRPCRSVDALRTRALYRRNPAAYTMGRSWALRQPTPKGGRAPGYKA